jgi:LysR family transcriptional regulator, transcriptional activator of the cysJI operon
VDLRQLKLFKDIATARSISRGASLNDVSQSAASQHVQEIEGELQVELLDRGTRPLVVTAAGKVYLDFCRDVLRRKAEFDSELSALKAVEGGTVRVASIYSVGLSEMSRLESEFARRHPAAILKVEYLRPERVYEAVLGDQADLGLVSYAEANKDIATLPWRTEEMAVASSPSHPLASRAEVSPRDLEGVDFVGFDDELPIRREVDRFLREHGVRVNLTMHFDNLEMVKEAVALGSGVSIIPARVVEADVRQGRIRIMPIEAPGLVRPLGIIFRRKRTLNQAAQSFLTLLQETPREALVAG